ncbi:armadillo-type protein [Kockovaella imperatae]|uniref:Armadillo-type protein n=1 Tax=Kockovaella imperatae TaxID=4999 RepID=A0A1Y1UJ70_9TREE|nr:armadillo-type protein [Kockovaella imperatae]ORX37597.1 armadillo-type protein [Kockovaella imperatae]
MDRQVLDCLEGTLSPVEEIRKNAEQQLEQLFLHPEGGLSLARILLSPDIAFSQRQSAGVLLRRYVSNHWSFASGSFVEPATPREVKTQIRPIVFHGLSDRERKVRTACASVVSTIATYDWPDEWHSLLGDLVQLLQSGSSDSVHGAMQVVEEFSRNILSADQIVPMIKELLPILLGILQDPSKHSPSTRMSAVKVYVEVLKLLESIRDENPSAAREALGIIGQPWIETFKTILGSNLAEGIKLNWDNIRLYTEIFDALTFLCGKFPKLVAAHLVDLLQLSLYGLSQFYPTFHTFHISSATDEEPPSPTSDVGGEIDLEYLPISILELLDPIMKTGKIETFLKTDSGKSILVQLVDSAFDYAQVSKEDEENWSAEPNMFVEDVDDDAGEWGLRMSCESFLGLLTDKWSGTVSQLLEKATKDRVEQSVHLRTRNDPDWWKPVQASLAIIGGLSDDIRELRQGSFDLAYLFNQVIPGLLQQNDAPFLQGRAFIFASQFASSLPPELAGQYLAAGVEAMASDNFAVKLSAVKTIKNFCRFLPVETMHPYTDKILAVLQVLLGPTSEETLYLVLETIRSVIGLTKTSLNDETILVVVKAVYAKWMSCSEDPIVFAIIEELYEDLASLPVISKIVASLGPQLGAVITQPETEDTLHLPIEGIQLASAFLARNGPIEPEYVSSMTAAILERLKTTDDNDIVQHGVIHLTLVIRKDCEKLVQWHDSQGQNGISIIFGLLGRYLAPTFSESGGIFVGELIMHMFRKATSSIGPVLPDLLRVLATRLASAKMPSFVQSLVLPFAYLLGTEHTESTITLLTSFDVPTEAGNKSALLIVLEAWCDICETISGSWNIRVSSMGMSKLFMMTDQRLRDVTVKGDLIITERNVNTIMTRSKTKIDANEYTSIPFPLKAFKLILKDVQVIGPKGKGEDVAAIEEDDGVIFWGDLSTSYNKLTFEQDEDWDDDDLLGGNEPQKDEFEYLSSWLDDNGHRDDAQDDDEDLRSDPLAQIDMGEHLTSVLRQTYATNSNGTHEMIEGLSDIEKGILRGVLTV